MAEGPVGALEQERVRVLPIRVGPPASCTLCCQVEGGGQLLPPTVLGGGLSLTTSQCQEEPAHSDG